jgi:hypothetical protein
VFVAALLASCETAAPAAPRPEPTSGGVVMPSPSPSVPDAVAVAFLQDLSPDGAAERIQPAFQAIELAFSTAAPPDGRPSTSSRHRRNAEAATGRREIVGDPSSWPRSRRPTYRLVVAEPAAAGVPCSACPRASVAGALPGTWT